MSVNQTPQEKGSAFEWWMFAFIAGGAGFSAFISLLIPPYVTESTGNAANAGIVMAIISLAAVLGPVLGGFADKYRAHRIVLSGGVLGMVLGFAMYAISAESTALYALDAIVLGVSIAAINAVGPDFVLGANLGQALQAKRLTVLNLLQPFGQVIGGALMAAAASLDFSIRFWIAAVFMLVCFVIVWFTTAKPAKRIILAEDLPDDQLVEQKKSFGMKQVFPTFIFILNFFILITQHALPSWREVHLVIFYVPIPETIVCSIYGHAQPFLTHAQGFFCFDFFENIFK